MEENESFYLVTETELQCMMVQLQFMTISVTTEICNINPDLIPQKNQKRVHENPDSTNKLHIGEIL